MMNPSTQTNAAPIPFNSTSSSPPALLPPPLLPNQHANQGPSPQFLEMMKRLEKEHGGQLPPGLGAFTAPPPLPGFENAARSMPAMFGVMDPNQNATDVNGSHPFPQGTILPAIALPRDMPAQPKGPSIPQIMEMQRKHQQYMEKQREKERLEAQQKNLAAQQKEGQGKGSHHHHHHHHGDVNQSPPNQDPAAASDQKPAAPRPPVDFEFRSELVDPRVDQWIDQEIAKKSASFRDRLGQVYTTDKGAKRGGSTRTKGSGIHNDNTVFLSKISNVLSSEHPDLGSRLDNWIDKQVDSALHKHKKRHASSFGGDDQDGGDVWLEKAMHHSESEEDSENVNEAMSRDFAKGMFFSSAKTNKAEFGESRAASWEETGLKSKSGHRKLKRRVKKSTLASTPAEPSQVVMLELESESFREQLRKEFEGPDHFRGASDEALFGQAYVHQLNFDPNDNRYSTKTDTNLQDPEYTDYAMQKVIAKHRRAGGVKSKHSVATMDKWTSIATGREKDPLEDLFPGSKFDFTENLASEGNFDLNHIVGALNEPSHKRRRVKRKSEGWGE
eukprot:c5061_g1_i1.p1 GENE.c5061_g1_i1~~c5061_g1_i1.p1  ORF type:complete len:654 (+),score=137.75 c5061_g1_i1:293-1963(+)